MVCQRTEAELEEQRNKRRGGYIEALVCCWALDDSRVLASFKNHKVLVFCAHSGATLHEFQHGGAVYVLSCHPRDPHVALSAGYDGRAKVLDIERGLVLSEFVPGCEGRNAPPARETGGWGGGNEGMFQLTDGQFSPDGLGLLVSDLAGQVSLYGAHSRSRFLKVPYDQFFASEGHPIMMDLMGYVLDVETGRPPHSRLGQDALCDSLLESYPDPLQQALQERRLDGVPLAEAVGLRPATPHAARLLPALLVQEQWREELGRGGRRGPPPPAAAAPTVRGALQIGGLPGPPEGGAGVPQAPPVATLDDSAVQEGAGDGSGEDYEYEYSDDSDSDIREYQTAFGAESDSWESGSDGPPARRSDRGVRRSSRAVKRRRLAGDDESISEPGEEDREGGAEGRARRAQRRRERLERQERRAAEAGEGGRRAREWSGATGRRKGKKAAGGDKAGPSGQLLSAYEHSLHRERPVGAYGWLLLTQRPFGAYIPQIGDVVAYIPQGHQQFVAWLGPSAGAYAGRSGGAAAGAMQAGWPWEVARGRPPLRSVERCRIVGLEYRLDTLGPNTLVDAELVVEPEEGDCGLANGRRFAVTLPHPSDGQPDFLVDWAAFVRARERHLRRGHRCKVFWSDDGEPGAGQWWEGTITGQDDVAPERWPESPWECYEVTYEVGGEPRRHSSWELFKLAEQPELAGAEDLAFGGGGAGLEPGVARRLAEAVEAARSAERWALFRDTPSPELSFEDPLAAARAGGSSRGVARIFYNACVPLPLGLDVVGARAANGYYRGARAARRDLELLVRNAEAFNGAESEISREAGELRRALERALPPES